MREEGLPHQRRHTAWPVHYRLAFTRIEPIHAGLLHGTRTVCNAYPPVTRRMQVLTPHRARRGDVHTVRMSAATVRACTMPNTHAGNLHPRRISSCFALFSDFFQFFIINLNELNAKLNNKI